MKREDLDFLQKEDMEKVMSVYGKSKQAEKSEIDDLKSKLEVAEKKNKTYEEKINEFNEKSKDDAEWKNKFEELQTSIKEQEAQKKAEEEDKILTNNIMQVFGDKKFTSDYAKNGLLNDIKQGLNKPENKGKGINELFTEYTKDKEGIFANPNQIKDMEGMGDSGVETPKTQIPIIF